VTNDDASSNDVREEKVSVCIIGGGVSGLVAAQTVAQQSTKLIANTNNGNDMKKVVLVEASSTFGGRVQSDKTPDGFTLDRGFAVFIEEYPYSKQLLDYDALNLQQFLPGALVKVPSSSDDDNHLARVSDPLRRPQDTLVAIMSPIGTLVDKIKTVPLLLHVFSNSIEELFEEDEISTLTCLTERWGFSDDMVSKFFRPFLEGIYLCPLEEQSSRMFHFVMKMFSEGAAALPAGGMQTVTDQLVEKAQATGIVDLRLEKPVTSLRIGKDGNFRVSCSNAGTIIADKVIVATEGNVAQHLISGLTGYEDFQSLPEQPQRSVGCLYYTFKTEAPVLDPILILSGIGEKRGSAKSPINNVCFPSVVNNGFAPDGYSLCSVTVLRDAMDMYRGQEAELDTVVRQELADWFPDYAADIMEEWEFKGSYNIQNAQPAHLGGPAPANVHQGRDCSVFRGKQLPQGIFICGDHMATSTLNGALQSGVSAGSAAALELL